MRETIREFSALCVRLMKERLTIAAVFTLLIGLAGGDQLKAWLLGEIAWRQGMTTFLANLTTLLNHPVSRVLIIIVALYLFGLAAKNLGNKIAKEKAILAAAMTKETSLRQESLAPVFELLQRYEEMRMSVEADRILDSALRDVSSYKDFIRDTKHGGVQSWPALANPLDARCHNAVQTLNGVRELLSITGESPPKTVLPEAIRGDSVDPVGKIRAFNPGDNVHLFEAHEANVVALETQIRAYRDFAARRREGLAKLGRAI